MKLNYRVRNCLCIISNGWLIKYLNRVGLFNISCGRPFHWYLLTRYELLQVGMMKANFSLCFSCKGTVEKNSFTSKTLSSHPLGKNPSFPVNSPLWFGVFPWCYMLHLRFFFLWILHLAEKQQQTRSNQNSLMVTLQQQNVFSI